MQTSFEYNGKSISATWFDVTNKAAIPNLPWGQVYAIGNLAGQVPLITSSSDNKPYNLPGGGVEPGESIEQALTRELAEECNMKVVSWEPLGYQICTEPDGRKSYQFRVYAVLEKIGEFINDPGGGVNANTLIPFEQFEEFLQYGATGVRLMALSRQYFSNYISSK